MLISVILSTFNWPEALDASLRGLHRQTDHAFEVIVADDGSGSATATVVEAWRARLAITHVWHEDRGFRLAEIRNRAIRASRGDYCIFLDGDCIPRPNFIANHRALAELGWFVAGNRVFVSRELTEEILRDKLEPGTWSFTAIAGLAAQRRIARVAPMLVLPLGPLRKISGRRLTRHVRGGNLAIWRDDLAAVDGFDAVYVGWGREDNDIIIRLMRSGVRHKMGRFATGVFHLWHEQSDRSHLSKNDALLDAIRSDTRIRALQGLSALGTSQDQ